MKKCILLLLLAGCITSRSAEPHIAGLRPGMRAASARDHLKTIGSFVRADRKRQEVCNLTDDPSYASLIVGFDAENRVRFVTAVARPGGSPVRYADVIDLAKASHRVSGSNHRYTLERHGLRIMAIGTDPEHLTYYSLEEDVAEDEDE